LEGSVMKQAGAGAQMNPLKSADAWGRVHGPLTILGHYTRLTFAPLKLSSDYGIAVFQPDRGPEPLTVLGLVVGAGIAFVAIRRLVLQFRRRSPESSEFDDPGEVESNRSAETIDQIGLLAWSFLASYALISNAAVLIGVSLAERLFYLPSV